MFPMAAVLGHPVAHSRSPLIHGYWLQRHGLAGAYMREDVEPAALGSFLASLAANGFAGANVTLPHKEAAAAFVRCDDRARRIGAVNTLWFEGGTLCGTNTDGDGFMAALDEQAPHWRQGGRRVLLLGAGGAARAIVPALLDAGVDQLTVLGRNPDRAAFFAAHYPGRLRCAAWETFASSSATCDLLINTTPLGMLGGPPLACPLDFLPASALVADIVYAPLMTDLLQRARARGLGAVDGLGMLLHQAVPGFERWFGVRPQVDEALRALIAADIEKQSCV